MTSEFPDTTWIELGLAISRLESRDLANYTTLRIQKVIVQHCNPKRDHVVIISHAKYRAKFALIANLYKC